MPYTTMEPRDRSGRETKVPLNVRASRWFRGLGLLSAVGLTLLLLVGVGAIAWFLMGPLTINGFTWEITSSGLNRATATQIALTIVAGVGASVALVVTYRRQRRLEDGHFLERLGSAAAQLGEDKPAVQFSGVYTLTALADESDLAKRQQVVDVLCAYIRLPYDPSTSGKAGAQTRVEKTTAAPPGGVQKEITVTTAQKPGEQEVRATIFRVIRDHLRADARTPWSELSFDFTGATVDQCDLSGAILSGDVSFDRATFYGKVSFERAKFSGERLNFRGATFYGEVVFAHAMSSGGRLDFADAAFSDGFVTFYSAEFSGGCGVNFSGAAFSGGQVFFAATFSNNWVSFAGADFSDGQVSFTGAQFSGAQVFFDRATFSGSLVSFNSNYSGGRVSFTQAAFSGGSVSFLEELALSPFGEAEIPISAWFHGGLVDFSRPRDWTVPPLVPWLGGEEPPEGVLPRVWPPELTGEPNPVARHSQQRHPPPSW